MKIIFLMHSSGRKCSRVVYFVMHDVVDFRKPYLSKLFHFFPDVKIFIKILQSELVDSC